MFSLFLTERNCPHLIPYFFISHDFGIMITVLIFVRTFQGLYCQIRHFYRQQESIIK